MAGKAESVSFENDGAIAQVVRGNSGAAILNITDAEQTLSAATALADGKYKDKVSGNVFKVKKGIITGKVAPYGTYILYK